MHAFSRSVLQLGGWNIDGAHARIANTRDSKLTFKPVIDILSKLDIFCLTETHCESTDFLSIPGFHIVHNNRPRSKNTPHAFGGLAVGVKTTLVKGVTFLKSTHSEYMWFKLQKCFFGLDKDIYICNVYISPINSTFTPQRDDIFSLIEDDIARFSALGNCLIIGDFNARTNCEPDFIVNDDDKYISLSSAYVSDAPVVRRSLDTKNVDTHGKLLLELCKSSGLRILNGRKLGDSCGNFTCFNHRGAPSVIDYILCNYNMLNDIEYFHVHDLLPYSIHCITSCTLKINWCSYSDILTEETPLHEIPDQFLWNAHSLKAWRNFIIQPGTKSFVNTFIQNSHDINISNTPGESCSDIILNNFYHLLENIGDTAGLVKSKISKRIYNEKSQKPRKRKQKWYDIDCKLLFRQLQTLARKIKKQPSDMSLVHEFRRTKKHYKKLLNKKKQVFRDNIFDMLDNMQQSDPKAFWNLYDELCVSHTNSTNPITPKEWLEHFSTLMNRNINHNDEHFEASLNNLWNNYDYSDNEINFSITQDEIIKAALKLKNNKAPGVDGIRNEMLKEGVFTLAPALCILFNTIYTSGNFPSEWRLTTLTVLHKKGDKNDPKNYRGIAVSSNLCKLFCLVLHNRLITYTDKYQTIPPEQIGFRKGCRTSDHVLVLKSLIDKYINAAVKSNLFVCFIDFSAAFDTVWRSALLYKLIQAGIGGHFINIIRNMYSLVSFTIKCDGKLTDIFNTSVGVKQGCILSPMFFNIFISDIPTIFDDSCDPVLLDNSPLSCLMYADDLVILSKSAQGLQNALDKLHNYCLKWKLLVNIKKSNVMIFNKSGHLIEKFKFIYGNNELKATKEYCYLGIIFTPSGSFQSAMVKLKDKALKAYFKIRENLYSNSYKCSSTLFRSLVQPIISYGSEVWAPYLFKNLNSTNFVNICDKPPGESLHLKFCKIVLGVHRKATNNAVRGELGSYPLLISMIALAVKYWWKLNLNCMLGSNSLVTKALTDNRKNSLAFTWSTGIKNVLTLIGKPDIWDRPILINKANFNTLIVNSLKSVYNNLWLDVIKNHQSKLRTYCQFKLSFSDENYVTLLKRQYRSTFCKLRISCHKLRIEMGRYSSPKLPPEQRICSHCNLGEIEDEFHFIMKCTLYNDFRQKLLSQINDIFDIDNFNDNEKFNLIMSANDYDTTRAVSSYIHAAFEKRSS